MKKIDYHIHTYHSFDSEENPINYIEKAIELGLEEICFTDHQDFDYPFADFSLNVSLYFNELDKLKKLYSNQITIKIGVEIGLDLNHYEEINRFISSYDFDFVIGSIHVIDNTEFMDGGYFNNLSKDLAHHRFFEETLKCVQAFDCFNVLGHMDYISRYGPYKDRLIECSKHQYLIDQILKTLIKKNKGIELNLSGYKLLGNQGFPSYDIIRQYYRLGGRIITIGSDSHNSKYLAYNLDEAIEKLSEIGFLNVSIFKKGRVE